jgi:hypothetical protein
VESGLRAGAGRRSGSGRAHTWAGAGGSQPDVCGQGRAASSWARVGEGGWRPCDGESDVTARPGRVGMALCLISELVVCGVRRMGRARSS